MFLACPQCDTHYKLDDLALGLDGRKVRCTTCSHVWHAMRPPDELPPEPAPGRFTNTDPIADTDMSVAMTPDTVPDTVDENWRLPDEELATFSTDETTPATTVLEDWPSVDANLSDYAAADIPDVVKPGERHFDSPIDSPQYMPMGLSANTLGVTLFLLPLLLTVAILLAAKEPLARMLPGLAPLYSTVGLPATPPGEGLRLSTLVAEHRIDQDIETLSVSAMLANISPVAQNYPPLSATVSGPSGAVLKTWNLPAPEGKSLASGEESPIKVEFKDVPDEAAVLVLQVREE